MLSSFCLRLLLGNSFWKIFHDATTEATKELVPHFDVLHVGFIKRACDVNLVFHPQNHIKLFH